MHRVAETVAQSVDIPLLHIADGTARVLKTEQIGRIGLLGTAFTMEQAFYKDRLIEQHGIEVVVPNSEDRKIVHDTIYRELCLGEVRPASRDQYLRIVDKLVVQGAEGVILGCTEICMLIEQSDTSVRLFDTTAIHANEAVKFALDAWRDRAARVNL